EMALEIAPSYLAIGPIFHTTSKVVNYDVVGIDELKSWSQNVTYPIVAIGGISLKNIQEVINIKTVDGIAMISEVLENNQISSNRVLKLLQLFNHNSTH
ncbi:MAG TPA: thiamine phosphate synthase, partial [Campylobacterales bacterium]|nr:thiamine phosphate synthase [Campylobacterales bacterium]